MKKMIVMMRLMINCNSSTLGCILIIILILQNKSYFSVFKIKKKIIIFNA